jgi:hypothetical protein
MLNALTLGVVIAMAALSAAPALGQTGAAPAPKAHDHTPPGQPGQTRAGEAQTGQGHPGQADTGHGQKSPGPAGHGHMGHGHMGHGQMGHGHMGHGHMQHGAAGKAATAPSAPGQDAFAALAEVVRILDADPKIDWSKVDLERLRQHLIDMNEVVLRSAVAQSPVPRGLAMEVTGAGRTEHAIRSMVVPHAAELDALPGLAAKTEPIPGGVRLTVTSRQDDERAVARLRALGFAGILTLGAHHAPHHLAMAKGEPMAAGAHKH